MRRVFRLRLKGLNESERVLVGDGVAMRRPRKAPHELVYRRPIHPVELSGKILFVIGGIGERERLSLALESCGVDRALHHEVERRGDEELEFRKVGQLSQWLRDRDRLELPQDDPELTIDILDVVRRRQIPPRDFLELVAAR